MGSWPSSSEDASGAGATTGARSWPVLRVAADVVSGVEKFVTIHWTRPFGTAEYLSRPPVAAKAVISLQLEARGIHWARSDYWIAY